MPDRVQMSIQHIFSDIQLAAFKPFDVPLFKAAGGDFVPSLSPVKCSCFMLPEPQAILLALLKGCRILFIRFNIQPHKMMNMVKIELYKMLNVVYFSAKKQENVNKVYKSCRLLPVGIRFDG